MRWTDELLDALRAHGDPSAEDAVRSVIQADDPHAVRRLLGELSRNDQLVPTELPDTIEHWMTQASVLPEWADPARLEHATRLFQRHGLQLLQHLMYHALPACYAVEPVAKVLSATRRLDSLAHQRVLETLQFVVHIMEPGGLDPSGHGRGLRSAQKVRLLHAAIRVHLDELDDSTWAGDAVAINQEELLAVLATFGVLSLRSLERMGIDLDDSEVDAILHTWNVVGWALGIQEELRFETRADGDALWDAVWRRHVRPSEAGKQLTAQLLALSDSIIPGEGLDGMGPTLLWLLSGQDLAEVVDAPQPDWTMSVFKAYSMMLSTLDEFEDRGVITGQLTTGLGQAFFATLEGSARREARAEFRIPLSLRDHWGLP